VEMNIGTGLRDVGPTDQKHRVVSRRLSLTPMARHQPIDPKSSVTARCSRPRASWDLTQVQRTTRQPMAHAPTTPFCKITRRQTGPAGLRHGGRGHGRPAARPAAHRARRARSRRQPGLKAGRIHPVARSVPGSDEPIHHRD
jgi:hypothetical protein